MFAKCPQWGLSNIVSSSCDNVKSTIASSYHDDLGPPKHLAWHIFHFLCLYDKKYTIQKKKKRGREPGIQITLMHQQFVRETAADGQIVSQRWVNTGRLRVSSKDWGTSLTHNAAVAQLAVAGFRNCPSSGRHAEKAFGRRQRGRCTQGLAQLDRWASRPAVCYAMILFTIVWCNVPSWAVHLSSALYRAAPCPLLSNSRTWFTWSMRPWIMLLQTKATSEIG